MSKFHIFWIIHQLFLLFVLSDAVMIKKFFKEELIEMLLKIPSLIIDMNE